MKTRIPSSGMRGVVLPALLFTALQLLAQTNSPLKDEALALNPPSGELPATIWEQYGVGIVVAAVALLTLVAFLVRWWLKPKPAVIVPIEIQVRRELEALRQRNEDGRTLSQVSRAVRRYIVAAFELPPDELVTSEFCCAIASHEKIGAELAAAVGEFLRRCDEQQFAPASSPPSIGAATRALELVELGEARRAIANAKWSSTMNEPRNETTLAQARLHWGIFILPMLVVLGLFLATLVLTVFLHFITKTLGQLNPQFSRPFGGLLIWISVLPEVFIGLLLLLVTAVAYWKSIITLTDRRLIFRTGWLTRVRGQIPLENVEAIIFTESLLGRFLGYGTVLVTSLGGLRFPLRYVASPQNFHSTLQKAVASAKSSTKPAAKLPTLPQ